MFSSDDIFGIPEVTRLSICKKDKLEIKSDFEG
jgi:hypothetical protein